jgi:hypothetical protein
MQIAKTITGLDTLHHGHFSSSLIASSKAIFVPPKFCFRLPDTTLWETRFFSYPFYLRFLHGLALCASVTSFARNGIAALFSLDGP